MILLEATADPFTWNQISVLITIIISIVGAVSYLTRIIDRKISIVEYERKHQQLKDELHYSIRENERRVQNLRDEVGQMNLKLIRIEERQTKIVNIMHKNGLKE